MDFIFALIFVGILMAVMGIALTCLVVVAIGKWIWSIATTTEEESLTEKIGFTTLREMIKQ